MLMPGHFVGHGDALSFCRRHKSVKAWPVNSH